MAVEKGLGDKCFEDLKMLPRGARYIAVSSSQNRSICRWTSLQIQSHLTSLLGRASLARREIWPPTWVDFREAEQ